MARQLRPLRAATLISIVAAGVLLVSGAPSAIAQGGSTFLTMSSQPGDYIGQGQTYAYTIDTASFSVTYDGSATHFSVITPGYAHWWYVDIAAPPGQPLIPGTYTNAVRSAFRGPGQPGLDVYGDGRGCNTLSGSFTVQQASYDAGNNVQSFDATFEQHCEGAAAALTGEISYQSPMPSPSPTPTPTPTPSPSPTPTPTPTPSPSPTPTPTPSPSPTPTPLSIAISVSSSGTFQTSTKVVAVSGTVTCSRPVTLTVSGIASQQANKGTASGSFSTQAACGASGTATWSATLASSSGKPFSIGTAQVTATASGSDPASGAHVSVTTSASVSLASSR